MSVNNPWQDLPQSAPYLLPGDRAAVEQFNSKLTPEDKHRLRTYLPPLPFQGRIDAPIVLLGLNPGYAELDDVKHVTPAFLEANRRNYAHESADYPFFFLDPQYAGDAGQKWWHTRLGRLRQESKHKGAFSDKQLTKSLLSVQYFPYRSQEFKQMTKLDSQQYGFALVKQAMDHNAVIILLRSRTLWESAVEGLAQYCNLLAASNERNPVLSPEQLGEEGWQKLVTALQAGAQS